MKTPRKSELWRGMAAIIAVGVAFLAIAAEADADPYRVWFPYANVMRTTANSCPHAHWGGPGSSAYKQLDGTTDNLIWPVDRVYYDLTNVRSWFDTPGDKTWYIAVHKPADNWAGTFKLRVYNSGGDLIDADDYFSIGSGTPQTPLLNDSLTQPGPIQFVEDNGDTYFLLTVPNNQSLKVPCWTDDDKGIFNKPGNSPWEGMSGITISIEQEDGYLFDAFLRGQDDYNWRIGDGTSFSTSHAMFPFGYNGIPENTYANSSLLTLSHFREYYCGTTQTMSDSSTLIVLLNTHATASRYILVGVYDMDGNAIDSDSFILSPGQRYSFTPSSYYSDSQTTTNDEEGYVRIFSIGASDVIGLAHTMRFPKSNVAIWNTSLTAYSYTRIPTNHIIPLSISNW